MNVEVVAAFLIIWSILGLFSGVFFIFDRIEKINYRMILLFILLGPLVCFLMACLFLPELVVRFVSNISNPLIKWVNKE